MAADGSYGEVQVIEARPSDVESLATILPRAFHPVNPYIKKTLPDTPSVREWWSRLFISAIGDPSCNVLIALDPATGKDIGVLNLRLFRPEERGCGFWTDDAFEFSPDINRDMCQAMVDSMIEYREKLMMGRPHFLIELFGVEQRWKGMAVGTKLLKRVCEIADEKGHDVFVQANGSAKGFYERQGFKSEAEVVMPGEAKYMEYMLVRRYPRK